MIRRLLVGWLVASWVCAAFAVDAKPRKKRKRKVRENVTRMIPKAKFISAVLKLAKDERMPVASSTLVEKGRGKDYYSEAKLLDNDVETFWAEGAPGNGKKQWVAFHLPDDTTHVDIIPGAGKEQFQNFNRPKTVFLDVYLVKLKRDQVSDEYKPRFLFLGRSELKFEDKPEPVRCKLPVKLPELALSARTIYVGVIIIKDVYKGQFNDTSIAEIRPAVVWGE